MGLLFRKVSVQSFRLKALTKCFYGKKMGSDFLKHFELFKKMLVRPLAVVEKLLKTLFYFVLF